MYFLTVTNYVLMLLLSMHITAAECDTALIKFKAAHVGTYQIDCIQIKGERI